MDNIELSNKIKQIVESKYPAKAIKEIEDRGIWYKHIYKIIFTDNSCVYVKLSVEDGSNIPMEKNIVDLLNENNIKQPNITFADITKEIIPYEYGIYEDAEGTALRYYIENSDKDILKKVYYALGEYFSKYAEVTNSFAGIWDTVYYKKKYPIHPIDGMYMLEIESGSGLELYEKGFISKNDYDKIKEIFHRFNPLIKALPIHLTHFSPFPWCIYISEKENCFNVSKVTAIGDILWWNEHATIAHVLYPPFYQIDDELRDAFMRGYNRELNNEIILFFKLFYRLCALNGTYLQPAYVDKAKFEESAMKDIKSLIEVLG